MKLIRSIVSSFFMLAAISGVASAAEPLTNTLTVHRVTHELDGREQLAAADTAKPGDVLEYQVELHNSGASSVRALQATLPIPAGVTLIPSSVEPSAVQASVDGAHFAPLPLMHRVRQADGTVADQPIPLKDYRFLRWNPTDVAPRASLIVHARVMLVSGVAAETTAAR